jgi:hypothetical protein
MALAGCSHTAAGVAAVWENRMREMPCVFVIQNRIVNII